MIIALGGLALTLSQGVGASTTPFEKGVQHADAATSASDATTVMSQSVPAWLIGAWVLVRCDRIYPDGRLVEVYGANPQGWWIIDAQGHYMMQMARDEQARFAANDMPRGMADAHRMALSDSNASFGWLNVDGMKIHTHASHAAYPHGGHEDGNTSYVLQGNQLTYAVTMPADDAGDGVRGVVVWRRLTM